TGGDAGRADDEPHRRDCAERERLVLQPLVLPETRVARAALVELRRLREGQEPRDRADPQTDSADREPDRAGSERALATTARGVVARRGGGRHRRWLALRPVPELDPLDARALRENHVPAYGAAARCAQHNPMLARVERDRGRQARARNVRVIDRDK